MDWIVISGVKPWDGRYPFDIADNQPTTREWGWIKRLSGYLPTTIEEGLTGADPELICAFAVIALRRAGKIQNDEVTTMYDRLADAPFDGASVKLETDTAELEDDAGPPAEGSNGNTSSSGPDSLTSSETSPPTRVRSGTPESATSGSLPTAWGN